MDEPEHGDEWLELGGDELPVAAAYDWAVTPRCGAVVLFSGTIRDHADGREGVEAHRALVALQPKRGNGLGAA